jgi:hypothetical protein
MVRLPLATIVRAAPDRDRVEIVVGSAAISLQCAKLKLFKIPGSVSGGILGKGGLVSFIPNQMQHEPVSVAQGTPLLRTDGLVLVSSTPKGLGHVNVSLRLYSVLTLRASRIQAAVSLPRS